MAFNMRILPVLLFFFLLGACGHNRLHLSKVGPKKVVDVQKERSKNPSNSMATSLKDDSTPALNTLESSEFSQDIAPENYISEDTRITTLENELNPEPKDTVRLDSEDAAALEEALVSEIRSRRSKNLFIVTLATMLLVIIPFAFIFFLGFYIAGVLTYTKANRSKYVTVEGDRYLRQAKTLFIIASIFVGLFLIGSAFIIVIFFL